MLKGEDEIYGYVSGVLVQTSMKEMIALLKESSMTSLDSLVRFSRQSVYSLFSSLISLLHARTIEIQARF